jgi:hypothetical protein
MHRWVLVTEEGEIVGHLAAVPQYYRIEGQRIVAHTPADYQVLPQYGFHAILLMRKFFRTFQNCVACDVEPAAISVESRLGAEVAGYLQFAAKLRDSSALPSFSASVPKPILKPLNWGLRGIDAALSSDLFGDYSKVEVLEDFDKSFDVLFERVACVVPCVPEKDATFLRWRYGPGSPHAPVTILGVRGEGGLLGYAVLHVSAKGQSDFRDAHIFDLTTLPGCGNVAWALLREALRHFRRVGARSIRYHFLESSTSPRLSQLRRLGFFIANKRRHALLVKFASRGLLEVANNTANWSYSVGDGEASFWAREIQPRRSR